MTELLEVHDVSKTFPGQVALRRVDLEITAGEIHALVGQNGSGKSTLVKILAGYHRPDRGGRATIAGQPFELGSSLAAHSAGIRFVHQDLALINTLSVADNLGLSPGQRGLWKRVDRRAEQAAAGEMLEVLGYDLDPAATVSSLAESERTAVALARALQGWLGTHRGLLVLDEVTASLPGPEVQRLFTALRRIRDEGVSILLVTHHLDEVLDVADRVTVLRDGRWMATEPTATLSHTSLVELILGRELADEVAAIPVAGESARPLLAATRLTGSIIDGIDVQVASGELLGVAGITGSGREELAGLLSGRLPRAGQVTVDDHVLPGGDPRAAIDAGLCCVPADRAVHSLLPGGSVRENLTLADLSPFRSSLGLHRHGLERLDAEEWVDRLSVAPPRTENLVTSLSGGNQQKVVMARWLRMAPKVLVLDEPTQGVDVGSKAEIHALIERAARGGAAVLVCSTDGEELARLCSEVIVLHRGRIAGWLRGGEVTADRIEELQLQGTQDDAA